MAYASKGEEAVEQPVQACNTVPMEFLTMIPDTTVLSENAASKLTFIIPGGGDVQEKARLPLWEGPLIEPI